MNTKIKPEKVLLVDDHSLFREGLKELIEHWNDFQVIGQAANGQEALELCERLKPDIVLMDIQMPIMNGVEATKIISQEFPSVRVIMLTMSAKENDLFEAIKVGAQGYLQKDINGRQLLDTLKEIVRGEAPLSCFVAAKILTEFNKKNMPIENSEVISKLEALTEREVQILQMVVDGLTNVQIGKSLYLSEDTIKKAMGNIMQKLHLNNRAQVVAYALRSGLAK